MAFEASSLKFLSFRDTNKVNWSIYYINRGNEWEEEFLRVAEKAEDSGMFKHIRVARFASRTLDHELERNTRTVVPYFSSTFILMGSFR